MLGCYDLLANQKPSAQGGRQAAVKFAKDFAHPPQSGRGKSTFVLELTAAELWDPNCVEQGSGRGTEWWQVRSGRITGHPAGPRGIA